MSNQLNNASNGAEPEAWDEAQLEGALERLDSLHSRVCLLPPVAYEFENQADHLTSQSRDMRGVITGMLEALQHKHSSRTYLDPSCRHCIY